MWSTLLLLIACSTVEAINRPVYKIILTQRGYTQFLQYDIETPPLREFTLCAWIRIADLTGDQSIFTYIVNGDNRVLRLWLDSGGQINLSINGEATTSTEADIVQNAWRHVCLSYQSDYGAWAIYIDGRLASCAASQSLYGFVIPGGGSIIIGYGIADNGVSNGLEGQVFGVNMILTSTIERNHTLKTDPDFQQKLFNKNKVSTNNNIRYIVLSQMLTTEVSSTKRPVNTTQSFIKFHSPHTRFEHNVGLTTSMRAQDSIESLNEKEILDFTGPDTDATNDNDNINFWNLINTKKVSKPRDHVTNVIELSSSATQGKPTVSEFETPPPPGPFQDYSVTNNFKIKTISTKSNELKASKTKDSVNLVTNKLLPTEVTPPPIEKQTMVYGQWTSSQFANSVLNYIKKLNLNTRELKKVPPTIPLNKFSDIYPYASELKVTKILPHYKIRRKSFTEQLALHKRDVRRPQINVEILEDDIRSRILEEHSRNRPINVRVTSRSGIKQNKDHRFYRNVGSESSKDQSLERDIVQSRPLIAASNLSLNKITPLIDLYKGNNLMSILPFLKSSEYYVADYENNEDNSVHREKNNMYTKSLSNANKWHNVKSYSNDYTPRQINMDPYGITSAMDKKIAEINKKQPSIRLKYKPEQNKVVDDVEAHPALLKGRQLASAISNSTNFNSNSVSILKYNHGFLPGHKTIKKMPNAEGIDNINRKSKEDHNFNQPIKIGNALNERHIIGYTGDQNKRSFIGGEEKIPDINRYRSDLDNVNDNVPPSLGPKICKNVEFSDRLLYIQPGGSVDITSILSPLKQKNVGIEFIIQNYKRCTLEESPLQKYVLLFIDWNNTPVRLFGGAYPKRTTDLCGFF